MTLVFRPTSGCGAACLDRSASHAHQLRRGVRATVALVILLGAAIGGVLCTLVPRAWRPRLARHLLAVAARGLLRALGVTMTRSGAPLPRERALLVANHISWLDIIAMLAIGRVRIVAKRDVAEWPLIGRLARLSGAIFIDRERPLTLPRTVGEVRSALDAGDLVVVFAEGTTSCGNHPIPYRPALFQAAIDASACVAPVHLRYRDGLGVASAAPAFIGDESLVTSLRRVLAMRSARLDVHTGNCLHPEAGATRGDLARLAGLA